MINNQSIRRNEWGKRKNIHLMIVMKKKKQQQKFPIKYSKHCLAVYMTRKRAKKITSVYHLHLCLARHIKPLTALTANKNQSICKTIRFDHTILCFVVAPTLHNAPTVISLSLQVFALRFLSMFFCRISLHCAAFFFVSFFVVVLFSSRSNTLSIW